ncbi:MAG: FtsX-like permease family protein, partial [Bacteroidota bacterium]
STSWSASRVLSPTHLWLESGGTMLKHSITYVDADFADMFSFEVIEGDLRKTLQSKNEIAISLNTSKAFFGYRNAIGEVLLSSDGKKQYTVGAVLENPPKNSSISYEMILPWVEAPDWLQGENWEDTYMYAYVMLEKGKSVAVLSEKFKAISDNHFPSDSESTLYLLPFTHLHKITTGNSHTLKTLSIIAIIVSLIAFINFINLLTAQSMSRIREVGVCKVLGSRRTQLIVQFSMEAMLVCVVAGVASLALSFGFTSQINNYFQLNLSSGLSVLSIFVVWTIVGTWIIGMLTGLYPALYLAGRNVIASLKGDLSKGSKRLIIQKLLITIQFVSSLVLIAGAFLIWRQIDFMKNKNLSLDKKNVLIVKMDYNSFPDIEASSEKIKRFKQNIEEESYVESTAFSLSTPGNYYNNYNEFDDLSGTNQRLKLRQTTIDASVVPTLKMNIITGRNFDEGIKTETDVVLINEAAYHALGWTDLQNKQIQPHGEKKQYKVIGVLEDFHYQSVAKAIEPMIFWYMGPDPISRMIFIRYQFGKARETLEYLKKHWPSTGSLAGLDYYFLDQSFDDLYKSEEKAGLLLTAFSTIGIFLASLGLLALASFSIRQKTKEIGIRKVMGANSLQIASHLSRNFLFLILIAIIVSCPLIWYLGDQYLQSFSYRITISPVVFVLSVGIVLVMALVSVGWRAHSAALADPIDSLRDE